MALEMETDDFFVRPPTKAKSQVEWDKSSPTLSHVKLTTVVVRLQIEATHQWPECPFEDVSFLKGLHRHMFHIECEKVVSHADRDIEIIRLKREIKQHLELMLMSTNGSFGSQSCEMIATHLTEHFSLFSCQVLEDGENGAKVYAERIV